MKILLNEKIKNRWVFLFVYTENCASFGTKKTLANFEGGEECRGGGCMCLSRTGPKDSSVSVTVYFFFAVKYVVY